MTGTNRRRWLILLACLVCQMGLGLGGYIFAVFLKPVVAEMGWSRASFAGSTLPFLLAMSLASPLVGAATERFGARLIFTAGITFVAVALGLFSVMQGIWQFYLIGFLLGGAVTGLGDIPVGAVVSRWFVADRGLALGVVYIGSNIGGAIVPLVATAVAAESSWRVALQVLAVGGWLVIVPFAFWGVPEGEAEANGAVENGTSSTAGHLTLREALATRSFWILCFVLFSFYFYYVGVNHHLVAFLTDSGMSATDAARRFSAAVAIGILGKLGTGAVADRVPKKASLVAVFALLTAGSWLLLAVGRAPGLLPVFLVIHGFAVAAENVVVPLIIAECFGAAHLAAIYGAIMLALLPGGTAGPTFAGWVFDVLGSYQPAFATFAVLNVVAVAALLLVRRESARG